jgi:phospholipid/cholesterol/gamma-HCH transport system substrate-binding protein
METGNEEYKVGIFVSMGLVILATMIFLLGGDKILFHTYYFLTAKFQNVDGLSKGSIVSLSGINIGNIEEIRFSKDNQILEVILRVDMLYRDRITTGSTAKISTKGALGDKFIFIQPGTPGQEVLNNGATIPTIERGDFLDTLGDQAGGVKDLFAIIQEMRKLLQNINGNDRSLKLMDSLNISAENLAKLTASLEKTSNELQKGMSQDQNFKRTLSSLTNILEKVDQGRGTVGALINDPALYYRLQELVGAPSKNGYVKSMMRKTIEKND